MFQVPFTSCWSKVDWKYIAVWQIKISFYLQMLDLFIGWDWTTFFADYGKPGSKYLRVNPSNAIILLEKYVMIFSR